MRLATFNVENMFERAKAMNLPAWSDGKPILEDYARLNLLIQEPLYSDAIKAELLTIMKRHKGLLTSGESAYILLRGIRGDFVKQTAGKPAQIIANGRADWIGWFELTTAPVKEVATENTGRVIGLLNADVLCVVEAESRTALRRFSTDVLPQVNAASFGHIMLIDGNDDRGIDVGVMARESQEIMQIRSHVDDTDDTGIIFSRDCAEYVMKTQQGHTLLLLVNHFKSKGYGDPSQAAKKRLRQATRVRKIYDSRLAEGFEYIAIVGDLNETPDGAPLDPLLRNGSALSDIMTHPHFQGDGRPGTHGNGTKAGKFDYILMSPKLADKVTLGGIERRGVWGGKEGKLFPHLETMKSARDAASDHAALWVDLDL